MRTRTCLCILAVVAFMTGCRTAEESKVYDKPLPPGQFALRKITDPADIPDITIACYELDNLRESVARSLNYLSKPSSKRFFPSGDITHAQAVISLNAFTELLDSGFVGKELATAIYDHFDFYTSVGCDDKGTVLFTGYYTPIIDGSFEPMGRFRYPLYTAPDDLVKDEDGEILGRRTADGQIVPYPARNEIEQSGMLKGRELVWLADEFENYVAHVQGSAKVRTPDGELVTIGYSANNGHEYKSVAKELINDGKIAADKISLTSMINYFKTYANEVKQYVVRNPRFVFFQMSEGPPRGSLNEPVTPFRTIATDKSIYPRGCLAFMSTTLPRLIGGQVYNRSYTGFMLDQDAGGAIRAPGRCDVYMGQGDLAGKMAGQVYQEGRLYYLFLKAY